MRTLVLAVLAASALVAGCIAPPEGETDRPAFSASAADEEGEMTATESVEEHEGVNPGWPPGFYAARLVTVEGVLTFRALPVSLQTVNGDVEVVPGEEGAWRLVATLRATGATPEQARANLEGIGFEWAHEENGRHFVRATVNEEGQESGPGDFLRYGDRDAHLFLEVPPSLLMALDVATTNGDVLVSDALADSVAATTTNGDVVLDGLDALSVAASTTNGHVTAIAEGVREARFSTTNGNVDAKVRPAAAAVVAAESTNGNVAVQVPEGPRFGYEAVASTTNGEARIELSEGSASHDSGPGHSTATFRSDAFESRPHRASVTLSSTNGNVLLEGY